MGQRDDARTDQPDEAYTRLAKTGPYDVVIGSALITMVEPHHGCEHAYNRWYEDDHFYSGAMAMPWMFAGRRWVATRELQLLRYPDDSPVAQPVTLGPYISTYWIFDGHYEDHLRWSIGLNQRLPGDDRAFNDRTHVYTSFQEYLGPVYRDAQGSRDIHSLDYPYQGLVVEVLDAPEGTERAALDEWLVDHLTGWLGDGPVAMTLRFAPLPLPADKMNHVEDLPGLDRRITLLHLLDVDPRACWEDRFAARGAELREAGAPGEIVFAAPFLPTLPGTDRYVDQLR
ncbi:MAG: hypothetical protein KDB21_16340 [Acidimicrobiales bacterium]|nr:hypothetical protein [Acidimicrobiales bacterium]